MCIRQRTSWSAGGLPPKRDSRRSAGALSGRWPGFEGNPAERCWVGHTAVQGTRGWEKCLLAGPSFCPSHPQHGSLLLPVNVSRCPEQQPGSQEWSGNWGACALGYSSKTTLWLDGHQMPPRKAHLAPRPGCPSPGTQMRCPLSSPLSTPGRQALSLDSETPLAGSTEPELGLEGWVGVSEGRGKLSQPQATPRCHLAMLRAARGGNQVVPPPRPNSHLRNKQNNRMSLSSTHIWDHEIRLSSRRTGGKTLGVLALRGAVEVGPEAPS